MSQIVERLIGLESAAHDEKMGAVAPGQLPPA
jgi:hypothetical protein